MEGGHLRLGMGLISLMIVMGIGRRLKPHWSKVETAIDATATYHNMRWAVASLLLIAYSVRVVLLNAFYLVTVSIIDYFLSIHLLSLFIQFLKPKFDPAVPDNLDTNLTGPESVEPMLPQSNTDEFRPFVRRLPELKFWIGCMVDLVVAFVCTFIPLLDLPVYWPILMFYFVGILIFTMRERILHMIKYNYVPFNFGKAKIAAAAASGSDSGHTVAHKYMLGEAMEANVGARGHQDNLEIISTMSDPSPPTYTPFETPVANQAGLNPSFAGEPSSPAATSPSPTKGEKAPLMSEQRLSDEKSSQSEARFNAQSLTKDGSYQHPQGYVPAQNLPPQAAIMYAPPPMPPPGFSHNLPDSAVIDATFAATDGSMNPPGYFSVSGVPTRQVLMRAEAQVPNSCFAQTERTFQEVKTHDPVIASNPDELFNYFLFHVNQRPSMMVQVSGTHQETRTVMRQVSDGKGGFRTEHHTETHTVTDFSINLDVSDYIAPTWDRIVATPKKDMKEPQLGEWRAVMEEFTRSKNLLKEIHMEKEILWDYSNIQNSIIAALRMSGYMHSIHVSFPKGGYIVSALSSSTLSKAADNTCVQNVNHQLFAYYQCVGTGREFYERNVGVIVGAAMTRTCGATYRAF
ncbi:hypothetical protein CcCBS67573_g01328 [Chytriomyces confervae]|uniref:Uncharacterized protein n=1 Tax=Chytriomyces confervae TaxID=246404 RepID=A0A507FLY6_9FUNG|nr:hypothetical protein CcCBS67573_g01328 [Chytriomyces confervae]